MTDLATEPATLRPVLCATCHSPAQLHSDTNPLGLEGEQWYECAEGHETKRSSEAPAVRRRL